MLHVGNVLLLDHKQGSSGPFERAWVVEPSPQQAHRVPSVALEAKGTAVTRQAPRFPEEKDPCQPQRRAVTRQVPFFPQEKDPCRSQRSPPSPGPAARHVGSRARRHLVAPEGWWRAGRGPGGEGRWHWYREKHKYCRVL